jgi:hypothetical protein
MDKEAGVTKEKYGVKTADLVRMEDPCLETRDCTNIPAFNVIQFAANEDNSSAIMKTYSELP